MRLDARVPAAAFSAGLRIIALALTLLAAVVAPAAAQRPALAPAARAYLAFDTPVVALTGVRVIDGTGAAPRERQTIVLRHGRIEAVGAGVPVPADAQVLDLSGHTVIPGLVSLHEHTWLGGIRTNAPMTHGPMLYLAGGVTTAMTAGTMLPYHELSLKRAIDLGALAGPRLHITGPYLTGFGGPSSAMRVIASPEEARRVVNYWADEGATWFKVMNGPTAVVRAVVAAAHARGLRVTGHLCAVTFTEAAALGVDALQHGFITNSEYVPGKQPDLCPPENQRAQADVDPASPAVQESIRRIVAAGAAVVSTLGVYESFVPERARLDTAALAMLTPELRAELESNHAALTERGYIVPTRLLERMMQWERAFVTAGGLLGAGSDPWGTGFLPGYGNLRNYELLIEAGFSAPDAVQILTLNGARILGEAERTGSIEAGKAADLVVIRGDPAARAADIRNMVAVFRDGWAFDPVKLREGVRGKLGGM
ncbi:MAG TPA: amidohydrolase family protein [Longimicrobiales bacterium]|nr:amidohydrolase family protein [Longimicrobiales bacterium]